MNAIADLLAVLPAPMRDPALFAVPFFVLLLVIEWTAARKLQHLDPDLARPPAGAYQRRDAWASLWMGLV